MELPNYETRQTGKYMCSVCKINKNAHNEKCYYLEIGDENNIDYGYCCEETIVYLCITCCTTFDLIHDYINYEYKKQKQTFIKYDMDYCREKRYLESFNKIKIICKLCTPKYAEFICNNCNKCIYISTGLFIQNNKNLCNVCITNNNPNKVPNNE